MCALCYNTAGSFQICFLWACMGDKLKWLLKEEGGRIFKSCDISLENTPASPAVSLALVMYACSDSAMVVLSQACSCNNSKLCLPSFVSLSFCTVITGQCCFFGASCLT